MSTRASSFGPSPIKSQVTNTAVGFTLVALVSIAVFLLGNAIAVGMTAANLPTPVIKTIAVKGLEEGPALVYVDVEFRGTPSGNLISAQTDGPLKVKVFISKNGEALPTDPSLSVEIPNGINLNLASKTAARLVIDYMQIQFGQGFDAGILSKLATAKIGNSLLRKEQLPNVQISVETRVVFKSLWIPLGFSINYPYNLDLSSLIPPVVGSVEDSAMDPPASHGPVPPLNSYERRKQEIIKNFDFKPRSVEIHASDSDSLSMTAVAAFPAVMIPEFLTVEVPTIRLKANFFEVGGDTRVLGMFEVKIDPFLLQTAPKTDLGKEIQVKVGLLIKEFDIPGLKRILELVRDGKMENIGIQIQAGNGAKGLKEGLMHWLRGFAVDILLKDFLKKEKKGGSRKQEIRPVNMADEQQQQIEMAASGPAANQVISFKFLKNENSSPNGLILKVKVLRSFAAFFIGKLPELEFEAKIQKQELTDVGAETDADLIPLFRLKVSSDEVTEASEAIEIDFHFEIETLQEVIHTGIRLGKLGSKEYHALKPEIRKIRAIKFNSSSNNIISKLAAIFNVEVLINDNGVERVQFQKSKRVIFPGPAEATGKVPKEVSGPAKMRKKMELTTDFTINNGFAAIVDGDDRVRKVVNIAAMIVMDRIPYSGDYIHASWESFTLKLKSLKDQTTLQFQIFQGALNLGITGGVKPISVNFSTGITVPSEPADLAKLLQFLKSFLELENIMEFEFELDSGSKLVDKANASIPCKKLLLGTTSSASSAGSSSRSASAEADPEAEKLKPEAGIAEKPKREDFIGKIQNSILSFVSFQASTWLFHVTYPNGHYCQPDESFDLKLKIGISIPMIEANLCSKLKIDDPLMCFASASISRPMKFSIDIVDGNVCHVESVVLPPEDDDLQQGSEASVVTFENNEIPIRVSIINFTRLVQFIEFAASKTSQFITIGTVEKGSGFNNLVGSIVSSVFAKEIPGSQVSETESPKIEVAPNPAAPSAAKKIISFNPDDPAILHLQGFSVDESNLELRVGFNLPSNTLQGIRIAKVNENRFEWPVLQWGTFEYTFGLTGLFSCSLSVTGGQIDLQDDFTGIVPSFLNDFRLRIKLDIDQNYKLGSTALRQIIGTFKPYFLDPGSVKSKSLEKYFEEHLETKFFYKFVMKRLRGIEDENVFLAEGELPLKDLVTVRDAIFVRQQTLRKKTDSKKATRNNIFADAKITIKTIEKDDLSSIKFPCLIPALCETRKNGEKSQKVQDNPFKLGFQLENILQPATQLIARHMGTVFDKFKMANYPSHFKLNFAAASDIFVTLMLNGAGIITVGSKQLESDRTAFISYDKETSVDFMPAGADPSIVNGNGIDSVTDIFDVQLSVMFPDTIIGLRSNFGIFRRESMLVPPITPVHLIESEIGKLTNPPFVITLSSDDPLKKERDPSEPEKRFNNLLSALVASLVPEAVLPGINPSDKFLASFYDAVKKPEPNLPAGKDVGSKTEMGDLYYSKIPLIGACLITGYFCDTQLDVNYNVMMPFANKILKMILPSTSIIRIYGDGDTSTVPVPFVQIVADAKKQRKLQVSSETGLDILSTVSVCFNGLRQFTPKTAAFNVYEKIWSKTAQLSKIRFQVILGHNVDINADFHFPIYTTKDFLFTKFKDVAWSYMPSFLKLVFPTTRKVAPIFPIEATDFFLKSRPERKGCREVPVPTDHTESIDYSKTVLFFEEKSMNIKPGNPFNVHLQLRTANNLVFCGLPAGITVDETKTIRVKFVHETGNSFVNLINLFSYKKPAEDEEPVPFVAEYNKFTNLFSVNNVILKHTGRYSVQLLIPGLDPKTISDTIVYVTYEY